jgi:hypothetical protein
MALIQFAALTPEGPQRTNAVALNRLAGIPLVLLLGLLSGSDPLWLTGGVFAVCVAEIVADWRIRERFAPAMTASILEQLPE